MSEKAYEYFETTYPMAGLNHTEGVGKENLGWTKGVLSDGVPFEAELWLVDGELTICIMLPEILSSLEVGELSEQGCDGEVTEDEWIDFGVLKYGLSDRGFVDDNDVVISYVEYIEEVGLVEFLGNYRNGAVHLLTDNEENDVAGVIITLKAKDNLYGETPLVFKSFPEGMQKFIMYNRI